MVDESLKERVHRLAQLNLVQSTQDEIARLFGSEAPSDLSKPADLILLESHNVTTPEDSSACATGIGSADPRERLQRVGEISSINTKSSNSPKIDVEDERRKSVKKPLVCDHPGCDKTFLWPGNLRYHKLTHQNQRNHACEECGTSFFSKQHLQTHLLTHSQERPYTCTSPGCDKAFTTQQNLQNHLRVHTGEKPYVCSVEGCGKAFSERSSLRKHSKTHTGVKNNVCGVCGKQFSQTSSMRRHMREKHAGHPAAAAEEEEAGRPAETSDFSTVLLQLKPDHSLRLLSSEADVMSHDQTTVHVILEPDHVTDNYATEVDVTSVHVADVSTANTFEETLLVTSIQEVSSGESILSSGSSSRIYQDPRARVHVELAVPQSSDVTAIMAENDSS